MYADEYATGYLNKVFFLLLQMEIYTVNVTTDHEPNTIHTCSCSPLPFLLNQKQVEFTPLFIHFIAKKYQKES